MIGKCLKYMRIKKGLTQKQLAKILNIAQTTLSGYETKYSNPTFDTIEHIANNCGYKIYFISDDEKDKIQVKDVKRKDI